jgi:aerobic carbon-monoxide dehydrogenase medium subunit
MIPPAFDYLAPETLSEAVQRLSQNGGAKILAGGQSLIPMMRFRLAEPEVLIDLNRLTEMEYIREEDGLLKIGALTREAMIDRSSLVRERYPLLADTARVIADPLVRNMSTVGGNLAHADPANDHPATMLAYGAEIVATGPQGERTIPVSEFFLGPFESSLSPDEILTEIRIPAPPAKSGGAYKKFERKVGDYATAAVAVQVTLDEYGNCAQAGIGLTNVGITPIRAIAAEQALVGQQLSDTAIREAARLTSEASEPESDQRGSAEYKRHLVRTLTVRALRTAAERAQGGSL